MVHANDGLDELSTIGPTRVSELRDGHITTWTLDPAKLGLAYARLSDLQVSSVDEAADMLRMVMQGTIGPMRDIALLNAAAGLVIAGKCRELKDGLILAADAVDGGKANANAGGAGEGFAAGMRKELIFPFALGHESGKMNARMTARRFHYFHA